MIQAFLENFSTEEIEFIVAMDQRLPGRNIVRNFEYFLSLAPEHRLAEAEARRKKVLRAGWLQIGIPVEDCETIDEHQEDMKIMAAEMIPGHPELPHIIKIIDNHDTPEVIISDITKRDHVSKADKYRLEYLGARVIYLDSPERLKLWLEFEENKTWAAQLAKDIDCLQMFKKALIYQKSHPTCAVGGEHIPYCLNFPYKTPEGQQHFLKLAA